MSVLPIVSFVLPAYKGDYLKNAIESILNQTEARWELIVVDDCSPDDLLSIVNLYDDSRISYYRNECNVGGSDLVRQWNLSIQHARGTFVVLASDDDYYEPSYLSEMLHLAKEYPDVDVFRPKTRRVNDQGHVINEEDWSCIQSPKLTLQEYLYYYSRDIILSAIPQFMFRKDSLILSGGFVNFPLAWFSDDATVAKLAVNNGVVLCDKVLFTFRVWGKSISGQMANQNIKQSRLKIDAGASFVDFIMTLPIDNEMKLKLLNRARLQSYWQVAFGSFGTFADGMLYMYRTRGDIYSLFWCIKHMAKNIRMRVSKRL